MQNFYLKKFNLIKGTMFKKAIIVAEIGCNHQGKIDKAKKLIRAAALCGANYVKFQKE